MRNKTKATPEQILSMHHETEWTLRDAHQNLKIARKHLALYNECVPMEFSDAEDSRASEREDLNNLLKGLAEMENALRETARCFFPYLSIPLAPVRVRKKAKSDKEERRLSNLKLAYQRVYDMADCVERFLTAVRELFSNRAIPHGRLLQAESLMETAGCHYRRAFQHVHRYGGE